MAIPVKINPNCDIDEQASTRLMFTENTASTAPKNIVIKASINKNTPHLKSPVKICELIAITPNNPDLVNKPDNHALAGAGAFV